MPDALIWGASSGIGRALIALLKQHDWRVFAAARDTSRVPAEVDFDAHFDAVDSDSIDQVAMLVAQETEGLDLVVYAAGGLEADRLKNMSDEAWSQVLTSNLTGAFKTARPSLSLLNEGGHMMFIGAYIDHLILPKMGAYAAAKAALEAFVKVLAKENRRHKFTLVRPGAVDTAFWESAPFKLPSNAKSPTEVANAMLARFHEDKSGDLNL
jgi:NAD(P)-dependent dehydrogenase (short-subunit alcohol dehydrogenase family)